MAEREIEWSLRSLKDKIDIFNYWTNRNKSTLYAKKLNLLFNEAMALTAIFPNAGVRTNKRDVKITFVTDFALVYRVSHSKLEVITVWDTRRNPTKQDEL